MGSSPTPGTIIAGAAAGKSRPRFRFHFAFGAAKQVAVSTDSPANHSAAGAMDWRDVLVAGLLSLALLLLLAPLAVTDVDQLHDGIMLKPALDVLSGQALFRESFTQYGALTTYLQVLALRVEPTLLALRYMTLGVYVAILCGLYAVWRQILPRVLAAFSCGLFMLFLPLYERDWLGGYWALLPWSSAYALMFQVLALFALCQIIRHVHATRWALILGAACACVFWCRQPVGVVTTGCLVVSWLALHFAGWAPAHATKRVLATRMLAGFLLVNALVLGNLALTNALPAWWYQNFTWPAKWARQTQAEMRASFFLYPLPTAGLLLLLLALLAPSLLARSWFRPNRRGVVIYYLVLAALVAWQHERVLAWLMWRFGGWTLVVPVVVAITAIVCLALVFRKQTSPHSTEYYLVAALAALAAGALLQYYPLPDPWHVLWAAAPSFGLVVYVFWRASRWPATVAALTLLAAFLPSIWGKAQLVRQTLARPLVTLEQPAVLRGMRVPPEFAHRLERIATLLAQVEQRRPGISSALIGNDALFACFTQNLTNPSPYYVTWPGLGEPADNQERWNYIHANRPLMYLHRTNWEEAAAFYRKERYVPVLYFHEDGLEVAIPQEIADALGITTYGAPKPADTPPR